MSSPPWIECAVGLGSNLGNRLDNLRRARAALAKSPHIRLTATAPIYETRPVNVPPEFVHQLFLNSLLLIESAPDPERILDILHAIEEQMGRDRTHEPRNGPRAIDLDLIYAGNITMDHPSLRLPHPRWSQRAFVAQPLADLRPNLILPRETRTVRAILDALDARDVRRFADGPCWWLQPPCPGLRTD